MSVPFFIAVLGPTAVGKTALVDELVEKVSFPIEVVNLDMGQFYVPLTIGTAKPDLTTRPVRHHLFDILNEPGDFTVTAYRKNLIEVCKEMTSRGVVPLLVGGSSFYCASLFYPPHDASFLETTRQDYSTKTTEELYTLLQKIDVVRAQKIHRHDRYRIYRALQLWHATGLPPSEHKPLFEPLGSCALIFLHRERDELAERIVKRTKEMFAQGWIEEVQGLSDQWHQFLLTKKLIGYPDIVKYVYAQEMGQLSDDAYEELVRRISQKTRGYAKRQITFWKQLKKNLLKSDPQGNNILAIEEPNLTLLTHDLYLEQLTENLERLNKKVLPHNR